MSCITVEMLKMIWAKNTNDKFKDNKVSLIHPNGWIFILGKFRTIPTEGWYHVRMHVWYRDLEDKLRSFDDFVSLFFGISLDHCHLEELEPFLVWCDDHSVNTFINAINSTKSNDKLLLNIT